MDDFSIAPGCNNGSQSAPKPPGLPDAAASTHVASKLEIPSGPVAALRVVIVEDDPASRDTMKALLELSGISVTVAADGMAGVETILRDRPDLALVDIGLPGLDGYQVARRVREKLPKGAVYLVALTGHGGDDDHRAALDSGFDEHFAKPLKMDNLYCLLRTLRERRGA